MPTCLGSDSKQQFFFLFLALAFVFGFGTQEPFSSPLFDDHSDEDVILCHLCSCRARCAQSYSAGGGRGSADGAARVAGVVLGRKTGGSGS